MEGHPGRCVLKFMKDEILKLHKHLGSTKCDRTQGGSTVGGEGRGGEGCVALSFVQSVYSQVHQFLFVLQSFSHCSILSFSFWSGFTMSIVSGLRLNGSFWSLKRRCPKNIRDKRSRTVTAMQAR